MGQRGQHTGGNKSRGRDVAADSGRRARIHKDSPDPVPGHLQGGLAGVASISRWISFPTRFKIELELDKSDFKPRTIATITIQGKTYRITPFIARGSTKSDDEAHLRLEEVTP